MKEDNPDKITLPLPSDDPAFFTALKELSEEFWEAIEIDNGLYGFQIQPGSKWKKGLTDEEIAAFEKELGTKFPSSLRNFYKTMNGLDKQGINVYGDSGEPHAFYPVFYSYPEDLEIIKEYIAWIFEANQTDEQKLKLAGASRIFPVFHHRSILVDDPATPVLSIYGDDVIFWTDSLSKLLATEIFEGHIANAKDFEPIDLSEKIIFWLDERSSEAE
ncbi:MAG TPA: SMI1/KNR4 family protein [Bacteroidia bacterium]|nr:SMI1/KNR4 family protein [Bacteroidia bacterium]